MRETGRRVASSVEPGRWPERLRFFVVAFSWLFSMSGAGAVESDPGSEGALRDKQASLSRQLADNPFHRPLVIESAESPDRVQADIYAEIDSPFSEVSHTLANPKHWCDVLILHLSVKLCHVADNGNGSTLAVAIGKTYDQPLENAYRVEFSLQVAAANSAYFDVRLDAKSGPMGTTDDDIRLEAVPLPDSRTFVHLANSYGGNFFAWAALKGYILTFGRGKVGFTQTAGSSASQPQFIGGVRAMVERNAMRYFLAVDAYQGALTAPGKEQLEKRLRDWFTATERYPRQLHEIDLDTYLDMKRRETQRQQNSY